VSTKTTKAKQAAKKPAKPAAKKAATKKPANKPRTRKVPTTMQDAPTKSTVESLLESIAATLKELVAIETYCATKIAEKYETPAVPAPAVAPAVAVAAPVLASVPAVPAPAQTAAPSAPATRPGSGTVGGLVWEYCDGLNTSLGRAPTKDELIAAIKAYSPTLNGQPVNELTASTQYSKWRGAQGLPRLPRGFGANKAAAVPAPTAPTIGAPAVQPAPVSAPISMPQVQPAQMARSQQPMPAPLPAATVPSIIAPPAVPAMSLPPWLRPQG
jgi:hypothetical protein